MKFGTKARRMGVSAQTIIEAARAAVAADADAVREVLEFYRSTPPWLRPKAIDVEFRVVKDPPELPAPKDLVWSEKDGTWIVPEGVETRVPPKA